MDDLIGALAEDVNVLFSDLLANFHVGTVHSTQCQCTVQHEFHIAGTGCFFGSETDLFGQIAGRDQFFGSGDVVVLNEYDLQPFDTSGSAAITFERVSRAWIMSFAMV